MTRGQPKRSTRRSLSKILKRVYGDVAHMMTLREYLVTVYRPHYSPIQEVISSIEPRSSVLELGCGTGPVLHSINRHCDISLGEGIDINARSIRIARRSIKDQKLIFRSDSVYNLTVNDFAKFDYIICFDVFHHIPKQEKLKFLHHLSSNMKKGTILIFKDLDNKPVYKAFANIITDWISTRSTVSYFSMNTIERYFDHHGFSIIRCARLDKWFWSHFILVAEKL